jgi:diguanylate cyclase (GGDEF)-like protein
MTEDSAKGPDGRLARSGQRDAREEASRPLKVLHIARKETDARHVRELLSQVPEAPLELTHAQDIVEASRRSIRETFGLVLADLEGSEVRSLDALRVVASQIPGLPIIVLADLDGEALAHTGVQRGAAQDYLIKGQLTGSLLVQSILYARERSRMLAAVRRIRQTEAPPSCFDRLTNLPNRQTFYDRLSDSIKEARQNTRMVGVLLINLEGFKLVHDTLGPSVGDPLLQSIAGRLLGSVTGVFQGQDMVARLSGDEFGVILGAVGQMKDVSRTAESILEAFVRPFVLGGVEYFISTTIGISLYPFDGMDAESMVHNADIALRRSKEQGSNNFQFYLPAVNDQFLTRLELQNSLRIALARDEFLVHYMPQIDVETGRIVSMEALARWKHPSLGVVQPNDFIPLAEESGLILPIGERVLRTACQQAQTWQQAGLPPIRVSVNFSARQFQHQNPVTLVSRVLKETGLEAGQLELEITESVVMKDADQALQTLRALKETGIRIAIDDFGTGYSSLSYLRSFPIDALKVDRTFVREITSRPDDAAIVNAVIAMAHSLRLDVIAEGVETERQLEWLHSVRCDEVQGFLISKPVPSEGAMKLLARARSS